MHLEISPRQTGKTTRLVKVAQQWADAGNFAVIVTPNAAMASHIKQYVNEVKHVGEITFTVPSQLAEMKPDLIHDPKVRLFFDEFDFIKSEIPILSTGYYVTTPNRMRTDVDWLNWESDTLLQLLVANNFRYEAVSIMSAFKGKGIEDFRSVVRQSHKDKVSVELGGQFMDFNIKPDNTPFSF